MSGSATLATDRFRFATPATRISATRTIPARSGACLGSLITRTPRSSSQLVQALGDDDRRGRLDKREMREGLWEVAEVPAGVGVELLGVQTERRGHAQQPLHQVACALALADERPRAHQPERADEERALLARQAVVGLAGAVAQDEAVLGQVVGDRQHAGAEA